MNQEFKEGDYIVVLRDREEDSSYFKYNYVYLQCEDASYLYTDKDCSGTRCKCTAVRFNKKHLWRYADSVEVEEYNKNNFPCNVEKIEKVEYFISNLNKLIDKWS